MIRANLIAAIAAFSAAAGAAQADEIKIGALVPLTGDLAAFGETSLNGVRIAVAEANGAGGVNGAQVEVTVGDTRTAAQASIEAAQRLVNIEGVAGLLGPLASGNTIPVVQTLSGKSGVPHLSGSTTAPSITALDDNDFFFRTVPSDAYQGVALAQVARERGIDEVAIIHLNDDYGAGLAESFGAAFATKGGAITGVTPYEKGRASYRGELGQLARGGADALALIGFPENGATILRQALEEGFFSNFIFTDGMKAPEVIDQIGAEFLNGSFGTAPQALADSDAAQRFTQVYERTFEERPPKPFIDSFYDAGMVLLLAMEKAGSTDGAAVRDAMRLVANGPGTPILPGEFAKAKALIAAGQDIDYVGASGAIDFDDAGDTGGAFAEWAIEGGEIVTKKVFAPAN